MNAYRLASFRLNVTPPIGHALCGGFVPPATGCDDPLEAVGLVLLGAGAPIVVCAVDWGGILNEAHAAWRGALAEAAGTVPERVAVHCVHQHSAPYICPETARLVAREPDMPRLLNLNFLDACLTRARTAVASALPSARGVTHVGRGEALVSQVASNHRVMRDSDGKVTVQRSSACRDPKLIALPEGLIDPMLKTITFFDGDSKLAACHYYATHPMSYYGDGQISSDFCGLARKRRQRDEPECAHLYFTGCAGNIGPGKYNDGSPESRRRLTDRIYQGIVASEASSQREPLTEVEWRTHAILPEPNPAFSNPDVLDACVSDCRRDDAYPTSGSSALAGHPKTPNILRNRIVSAYRLAWLRRLERKIPLLLSAMRMNAATAIHLPGEIFIEYQLRAQRLRPGEFVAIAAHGDSGPTYVPTKEEYPHGGYEVDRAGCSANIDELLTASLRRLLG